jgi:uncharacterized protein involved in tolerance to divalent cations
MDSKRNFKLNLNYSFLIITLLIVIAVLIGLEQYHMNAIRKQSTEVILRNILTSQPYRTRNIRVNHPYLSPHIEIIDMPKSINPARWAHDFSLRFTGDYTRMGNIKSPFQEWFNEHYIYDNMRGELAIGLSSGLFYIKLWNGKKYAHTIKQIIFKYEAETDEESYLFVLGDHRYSIPVFITTDKHEGLRVTFTDRQMIDFNATYVRISSPQLNTLYFWTDPFGLSHQRRRLSNLHNNSVPLLDLTMYPPINYATTPYNRDFFSRINGVSILFPFMVNLARYFTGMSEEAIQYYMLLDSYTLILSRNAIDQNSLMPYLHQYNTAINNFFDEQAYKHLRRLQMSLTTVDLYTHPINNEVDITVGTMPTEKDFEEARVKGFELIAEPFVNDAFIFITHKDNPVNNLTSRQIKGIYSGTYTNWASLGGHNESIIAYQRNPASASQKIMQEQVMQGASMVMPPRYLVAMQLSDMIRVFDNTVSSGILSYSLRYYLHHNLKAPQIKTLQINGITPNSDTIESGIYPYISTTYLVYRSDAPAQVKAFVRYLCYDPTVKNMLYRLGYVPYSR